MAEIGELQEEVYSNVFKFQTMSSPDKKYHIELLERLMEKQQVMYTRLSLSDDPKALEMKKQLEKSVELMGFPAGTDISVLFNGMNNTIDKLKQVVDP